MNVPELLGIAAALAADAVTYAFSYGLQLQMHRRRASLMLACTVGFFQGFMPLLGYVSGTGLRELVQQWGKWGALIIFCALGLGTIRKALCKAHTDEVQLPLGLPGLLLVGIATSIDAFSVGICMAIRQEMGNYLSPQQLALAAGTIGLVTFAGALIFFRLARVLRSIPERLLQFAAGLILIALGINCVC